MGRGGKRSTSFKIGQSGNPNGRPKVPIDLKEAKNVNKIEFERVLNKYMYLAVPDIDTAMKSRELPMIEMIVAKIVAKAFNEGDQRRLEFIIDRLIGKCSFDKQENNYSNDIKEMSISNNIKSFGQFCIDAGYPEPYPKQKEMRGFAFDETDTRLLLGARKYGKTDYVTIMGLAYDVYLAFKQGRLDDTATTLIITKSATRNSALVNEIADALEKNEVPLAKRNSKCIRIEGHSGKDHNVEAITIKTSMRGRHPFRIIMDDPVTEEDVSEATRKTAKNKYDEAYKLCKNICIIGQPAHAHDLYAKLRGILKKMEVPHGTIPELDDDLEAMRLAGVSPESIEMSYHLRIPVTGTTPFAKIKRIDKLPPGDSVMFIDPSDGGDHTAASAIKQYFDGVAVRGIQWKKAWYHCIPELVQFVKDCGVKRICFETNATGRQPLDQLREIFKPLGIGVVGVHSDTNKHAVIMAAGQYAHMIYLSHDSESSYTDHVIEYEYGAKFDDAPDSLARGLEWIGLIKGKPNGKGT